MKKTETENVERAAEAAMAEIAHHVDMYNGSLALIEALANLQAIADIAKRNLN